MPPGSDFAGAVGRQGHIKGHMTCQGAKPGKCPARVSQRQALHRRAAWCRNFSTARTCRRISGSRCNRRSRPYDGQGREDTVRIVRPRSDSSPVPPSATLAVPPRSCQPAAAPDARLSPSGVQIGSSGSPGHPRETVACSVQWTPGASRGNEEIAHRRKQDFGRADHECGNVVRLDPQAVTPPDRAALIASRMMPTNSSVIG
jgi:hypothetical protein